MAPPPSADGGRPSCESEQHVLPVHEERSSAPSPELPPYEHTGEYGPPPQALDGVGQGEPYKPPQLLPDSPPHGTAPSWLAHPAANDWTWGEGEGEVPGWGPSRIAEGAGSGAPQGSPNSMHVSARQSPEPWELADAFAAMEDDSLPAGRHRTPQYGDGLVQEKLAADLCAWPGYIPLVDMGRDVGELWNVTVVRVPDTPPPAQPATAPATPVALSSAASIVSLQSAASAPEATRAPADPAPEPDASANGAPRSTPPPPPQHTHNPPTLSELRALLPYPLHLSIPFLPHAWLPLVITDSPYPVLASAPPVPLPAHADPQSQTQGQTQGQQSCAQLQGRAHHFHLLPRSVPPPSALRLPPPAAGTAPPLLDLWFCCQCRVHALAPSRHGPSPSQPVILPPPALGAYIEDRMRSPPLGLSGPDAVLVALETLMKMIEGLLWGGKTLCVKVRNPLFARKVGWNDTV
ncbi:hypothetical protein CALCODRAFT_141845 [Calocera cornea HHB12733]|uniref:Uncharacterized protein n=1 Tax=Calocera cornea HHB12733 TaxID=1353952 RepID=A0A165K680_9BASI|nr:hypothetical protein CALCODRAFT_141845 [Calocera cornea HHB12733]